MQSHAGFRGAKSGEKEGDKWKSRQYCVTETCETVNDISSQLSAIFPYFFSDLKLVYARTKKWLMRLIFKIVCLPVDTIRDCI